MPMDNELSGKVALVTGGSRGIGRAIAFALAREGVDVAVNYRVRSGDARSICSLMRASGRRALPIQADVSVSSEVTEMVSRVRAELGEILILVNNAGIARAQSPEIVTEESWDEMLNINLKSCFLVIQAVLPAMRAHRWGRIINISSLAAQRGGLTGPHYSASKAGMIGLTHYYANFCLREGITVNAIAPALIDTEMARSLPGASPDLVPMGRYGTVDEVAQIAVLLARDAFITGQTINVNGGWYMT